MSFRRLAVYFIVLVIIVGGIVATVRYFNTFQTVDIAFSQYSVKKAVVYPAKVGDGASPLEYYKNQPLKTVINNTRVTLKKGHYVVIAESQADYKQFKKALVLSDEPTRISISQDYTQQRLDATVSQHISPVAVALKDKYPQIDLYTINPGKLYKQGQWYGTTLTYNDQTNAYQSDTLRVILKKENQQWKVITDPPSIIISKVLYPQIPGDVVSDVDSL